MTNPTDDKLEEMAMRWDEAQKLYEDAGVFGMNGADLCRDSAAMLRACKGGAGKPRAYLYRYTDPLSGRPVWRSDCNLWNGQRPVETLPLYEHPAPDARQEGWRAGIQAAADFVEAHEGYDSVGGEHPFVTAIRALAEKGPDHD